LDKDCLDKDCLDEGCLDEGCLDKGCLDKGCDCCLKANLICHGLDFGMSKKLLKVPFAEIAHPNSSEPESPHTQLRRAHVTR